MSIKKFGQRNYRKYNFLQSHIYTRLIPIRPWIFWDSCLLFQNVNLKFWIEELVSLNFLYAKFYTCSKNLYFFCNLSSCIITSYRYLIIIFYYFVKLILAFLDWTLYRFINCLPHLTFGRPRWFPALNSFKYNENNNFYGGYF